MIVVDASLATKWMVIETDQYAAVEFFGRYAGTFAAPDLLLSEVSSAIVRRGNEGSISRAAAVSALARWAEIWDDDHIVAYRLHTDLVARAAQIAMDLGHPLADCIYLALALDLNCELATCDARFRDKAAALYPRVRLLAEFS